MRAGTPKSCLSELSLSSLLADGTREALSPRAPPYGDAGAAARAGESGAVALLAKTDSGRDAGDDFGLRSASSAARFDSARFRYDWKKEPVAWIQVLILASALLKGMRVSALTWNAV